MDEDYQGFNKYISILNDYIGLAEETKRSLRSYPVSEEEINKYIEHISDYIDEINASKKSFKGFICIKGIPEMLRAFKNALDYFGFDFDPTEELRILDIDDVKIKIHSELYLNQIQYIAFSRQIIQSDVETDLPTEMIALVPPQVREVLW